MPSTLGIGCSDICSAQVTSTHGGDQRALFAWGGLSPLLPHQYPSAAGCRWLLLPADTLLDAALHEIVRHHGAGLQAGL